MTSLTIRSLVPSSPASAARFAIARASLSTISCACSRRETCVVEQNDGVSCGDGIDERRIPVDGKVVVARTRDGGRSFEVLKNGLPQRHAYDLVWRHALAVDETGELLAFGSTSGGLWISENGGDSWTMPEARLPPIRAVRFAPALH